MDERIAEQWETNAEVFAKLIGGTGTPHHREILNPCVDRLLGDVNGKKLLDAGCGEGYLSRHYAHKGAIVTGVDTSRKLIDICRKLAAQEEVSYDVGNICNLHFISNSAFDLVLCNLVLLNIACLPESLGEFNRVLRPGGILVFSVVHPAFNVFGPGSWEVGEKDPKTRRRAGQYFKVDRYFDEKEYLRYWRTRKGEKFPKQFSFYHRTISTYVNALNSAGFSLVSLREPRPVSDNTFFDRERRIPFFLVFKAEKTYML